MSGVLPLLLALVVQSADSMPAPRDSSALARMLEDVSRHNRVVPAPLKGYTADVESEIGIVARRPDGNESAVSVEQTRNAVRWDRSGAFEQRVVGYRSQSVGLSVSTLSFLRSAWTVPVLYGNRLTLLFGRDTTTRRRRGGRQRPLVAVHPLAADRDRLYRFGGGDTVVTLRVDNRAIPIVRVHVEPRDDTPAGTLAFRGELDIDPTRHALVRMRGHFVSIPPRRSLAERMMRFGGLRAVAFLELENAEFEGQFWLPIYQRLEAQAGWTALSDGRSVFRIVSRFRDHRLDLQATAAAPIAADTGDTLRANVHRLTLAPADSLTRFTAWRTELGRGTSEVHGDDFLDVAPDVWRPTGPPRFAWRAQRAMDVIRFNRVEGLFTGVAGELRFRDAAPGLTARGSLGRAWAEPAMRGRFGIEWNPGGITWTARAGRALDLTNDFRSPFDSGASLAPLIFSVDPYDYVDRRSAAIGVRRAFGRGRALFVQAESGPASDRMVWRGVTRGLLRPDSGFRENRGVRNGTYWRSWVALDWHPDVSAEFMRTGVGGRLSVEQGAGALDFTRIEGRLMARRNAGAWTVAGRADVGVLISPAPPPQQLFELGANQNLPGFSDKAFAGTQAAVVRALVMYRLPLLRAPWRVRRWILPSPSPALAWSLQGGWADAPGDAARRAVLELGTDRLTDGTRVPVSRTSDGVRASSGVSLRFFGGALGIGVARPIEPRASWRVVLDLAQIL